jgi:hypothetical protein
VRFPPKAPDWRQHSHGVWQKYDADPEVKAIVKALAPTRMQKIGEGIRAVVIWCLCAGVLVGISYGISSLTYNPGYATKGECLRALFEIQYHNGHHGEECDELENGHWKIFGIHGEVIE